MNCWDLRDFRNDLSIFIDLIKEKRVTGDFSDLDTLLTDIDDKELVKVEAIIQSMTKKERQNPSLINASRKKRIAKGSGTHVSQVNRLLKQFEESKKMMKQFTNMSKSMKKGKMKFPFPGL